eukprot:CAMPEP_0204310652 /NCGR_PEP_ID=MMETSP0469-20131031/1862_1 /ASSEMBLY_ACC=CAM_ASM_000384 /TAXON_ID=2969 /ORGANISM="Oxyrrhis marina" /LENGTH=131 /DNA_ID=CAMNT_0051290479 /DNA_START=20 /DNA_END=415 /DNA_ORIENTATION=+
MSTTPHVQYAIEATASTIRCDALRCGKGGLTGSTCASRHSSLESTGGCIEMDTKPAPYCEQFGEDVKMRGCQGWCGTGEGKGWCQKGEGKGWCQKGEGKGWCQKGEGKGWCQQGEGKGWCQKADDQCRCRL